MYTDTQELLEFLYRNYVMADIMVNGMLLVSVYFYFSFVIYYLLTGVLPPLFLCDFLHFRH